MRSSRALGILAGTTALAFATLVVASPAAAATLPDGQRITIVEVPDAAFVDGQFYDVNPANAASTPVGVANGAYVEGTDVNNEGLGYAVGIREYEELGNQPTLWAADANTGLLSNPAIISLDEGDLDSCDAIDLMPSGEIVIACVDVNDGPDISYVGTVNPTTGVLTPEITLTGEAQVQFTAIAYNPVTGVLWGFAPGQLNYSYILDRAAGTSTIQVAQDDVVWAADFDRNGQLFVSTQVDFANEFDLPGLATVDPAVGDFTVVGPYVSTATDSALTFVLSLTIWGSEPALAATGGSAESVPVALGSALLLLAGAAFIATARLQRRRA